MSYKVYDTAGTFSDFTNNQQFISASAVNLTDSVQNSDVYIGASATVKTNVSYANVHGGSVASDVSLEGNYDTYYGGSAEDFLITSAAHDVIIAGTAFSNVTLHGSQDAFYGNNSSSADVYVKGTSDSVYGGSANDIIGIDMSLAVGGFLDGGGGSNTLLLNDPSTDGSNVSFDLAKGGNVGPGGVYAQDFTSLSYHTNNDGGAKTGSTTFRLEGGQNTIDYTYSSGANTVYNMGGVTTVKGGTGTDVVVGGTGTTTLTSLGGADYLYGGSGTDLLTAANATGGTDYLYAGSGSETFNGSGGTGNEYMYGAGGTDLFYGGNGNNVLVEGTHSDVFHGGAGTDYIYGNSGASQVYGGSGTDFVYTGASNQYFYSGTGKEYLYEQSKTMTNGRLDILDNFQAQGAGGKGTFIFEPAADANSTTFVASNGGTYIVNPTTDGSGGTSDVFVPNIAPSTVKAQTYFNL